jgi:endonuclease YncB( thermonuclease family)
MPKKLTAKFLEKKKIPKVLIAGLLMASVLGWTGWKNLTKVRNYYQIKQIFPQTTVVKEVIDGDTVVINNGLSLRLLGVDAPNRGEENYDKAKTFLASLVLNKKVILEYDAYQDDKFGRILAYVWIPCQKDFQEFCHQDKALVNEIMIKKNFAKKVVYQDRKKLKYDSFLNPQIASPSFY